MKEVPESQRKYYRILSLWKSFSKGEIVQKEEAAIEYKVALKTIQRDLDDIRSFLANQYENVDIVYDPKRKGYYLQGAAQNNLTSEEILAICKILLESRALLKKELVPILDKLESVCADKEGQRIVKSLIRNEEYHYIELQHQKPLLDIIWGLGGAVYECKKIKVRYLRAYDSQEVNRILLPLGIMFSEYYFYLIAFIDDKTKIRNDLQENTPTIYRIDRISNYEILREHFSMPYTEKFEEGVFRKRAQYMYSGEVRRVQFDYLGPSLEAVLDRMPTAKVIQQSNGKWRISAEVMGNGVEMWLRSQGEYVVNISFK